LCNHQCSPWPLADVKKTIVKIPSARKLAMAKDGRCGLEEGGRWWELGRGRWRSQGLPADRAVCSIRLSDRPIQLSHLRQSSGGGPWREGVASRTSRSTHQPRGEGRAGAAGPVHVHAQTEEAPPGELRGAPYWSAGRRFTATRSPHLPCFDLDTGRPPTTRSVGGSAEAELASSVPARRTIRL
jgi:hypothetical protein